MRLAVGTTAPANPVWNMPRPQKITVGDFGRGELAGGDVGVLGREVGAHLAALTRPLVALLQVDLVVRAVLHPDLEHALDVHLRHLLRRRRQAVQIEHRAANQRGAICLGRHLKIRGLQFLRHKRINWILKFEIDL